MNITILLTALMIILIPVGILILQKDTPKRCRLFMLSFSVQIACIIYIFYTNS
ncbi:hypothetical protein [Chryseobacterium sp. SNU WT5]|uniref:hypothetical protein n=1 Tax=Chryseobacterium sp. SNU WT5 TaxID=2594269 RepID=UPI00162561FB|nr:hypothetical protein [Chryseobacterium sp. SNU WT5]